MTRSEPWVDDDIIEPSTIDRDRVLVRRGTNQPARAYSESAVAPGELRVVPGTLLTVRRSMGIQCSST